MPCVGRVRGLVEERWGRGGEHPTDTPNRPNKVRRRSAWALSFNVKPIDSSRGIRLLVSRRGPVISEAFEVVTATDAIAFMETAILPLPMDEKSSQYLFSTFLLV